MSVSEELDHNAAMRKLDRELGKVQLADAAAGVWLTICKAAALIIISIAAITYANNAHARDLAFMPNQAGGEIVLTDVPSAVCTGPARIAYSRGEDGGLIVGCWYAMQNYVHIKWHGGSTRVFRYSQFTAFDQPVTRAPDMRL